MEKELIHLNSLSEIKRIVSDPFYSGHTKIYDLTDLSKLKDMTETQYRYFLMLLNQKKWFDIKKLLDSFLTHKERETVDITTSNVSCF